MDTAVRQSLVSTVGAGVAMLADSCRNRSQYPSSSARMPPSSASFPLNTFPNIPCRPNLFRFFVLSSWLAASDAPTHVADKQKPTRPATAAVRYSMVLICLAGAEAFIPTWYTYSVVLGNRVFDSHSCCSLLRVRYVSCVDKRPLMSTSGRIMKNLHQNQRQKVDGRPGVFITPKMCGISVDQYVRTYTLSPHQLHKRVHFFPS